jgi:S-formylglutathione hydrolase
VMDVKEVSRNKAFGCDVIRFSFISETLGGLETNFHAILPPQSDDGAPAPVLYYLSGLTCDDTNVIQKAGAAQAVAKCNVVFIAPDTSPRGAGAPGEDDSWDFGSGAGFYVDAVMPAYSRHYNMYSFVQEELPTAIAAALGDRVDVARCSIMGHSMGGHGALVAALRNPGKYRSVSAFSPVCHPSSPACPWGVKAFGLYLGENREAKTLWAKYDATELLLAGAGVSALPSILIDQGTADNFLESQLLPNDFADACKKVGQNVCDCLRWLADRHGLHWIMNLMFLSHPIISTGIASYARRLRSQLFFHPDIYSRAYCYACFSPAQQVKKKILEYEASNEERSYYRSCSAIYRKPPDEDLLE